MTPPKILTLDIERRLLAKSAPAPDGCRLWTAATNKGYGVLHFGGKVHLAHRLACELAHGPAPEGKLFACHHCDTPACISGDHLYWGSPADNMRDKVERGRAVFGRAGTRDCINGHEYTEENTYWEPRGWGRACKTCRRDAVRRMRAKRMAAKSA